MRSDVPSSRWRFAIFCFLPLLLPLISHGQQPCTDGGIQVDGRVVDRTGAAIVGAVLTLDQLASTRSDQRGEFLYNCVTSQQHILQVAANGFAERTLTISPSHAGHLRVVLQIESVQEEISVSSAQVNTATGERTLAGSEVTDLADDPDDLQRQLQSFTAAAGGLGGVPLITVDGFRLESRMPPKNAIAFIRINPDLFSAEFTEAPYDGGRIEIYTKPGQSRLHGDLFFNDSEAGFNAKDPLSTRRAALTRRRTGFDLSGPLFHHDRDFSLSLERREINDFAVVNATVLDAAGNRTTLVQNVPTPQHLWEANARVSFLTSPRNMLIAGYTANVNQFENVSAGGITLQEAAYGRYQAEHTLRLSDVTTVSPRLMQEFRISLRYRDEQDTPNSTATQAQVAGAFTSGGADIQASRNHEAVIQAMDDVVLTRKQHSLKLGVQVEDYFERIRTFQGFNGTYLFGGGTGPELDARGNPIAGTSIVFDGLEQYRRAQRNLAGGAATTFSNVAGQPGNNFNQFRASLYVQDQWKLSDRLQVTGGLRYAVQTEPLSVSNITPRLGASWVPDKKRKWSLSGRVGLFLTPVATTTIAEAQRLDGTQRTGQTIYTPIYVSGVPAGTIIKTIRSNAPSLTQSPSIQSQLAAGYSWAKGWNISASWVHVRQWSGLRTRNINSPLDNDPLGLRPGPRYENILQFQQTGSVIGDLETVSFASSASKRIQFYALYVYVDLQGTIDKEPTFSPQSSNTDAGEWAQISGRSRHNIVTSGQAQLPFGLTIAHVFRVLGGTPYNLVTGIDRNGDGNFNDRPELATLSTPGAIDTRYGWLVSEGGNGTTARNAGLMPWNIYLDTNLTRRFVLNPKAANDRRQTLSLNLRSANLLNHTNVTTMGSILGSPSFDRAVLADPGRRLEFGVRYAF
ncbi:TonB-dependent receptor [Terriglobus albidus]|uniref:TonB-dependent receptor n=1 Tax=Terriglobus albidus TaxID=1592106 RepID=UPI0021E0964E|nr:TonB-dependent receptor [Terriglobus albidus]